MLCCLDFVAEVFAETFQAKFGHGHEVIEVRDLSALIKKGQGDQSNHYSV